MEDSREPYRRGPGHTRLHPYDGHASSRDQYYGGHLRENRDSFRRSTYDRGFASPLGRADHDRRAYSPDRAIDRERAPRYHLPERLIGYRSRDESFRREAYGYRGDGGERPPFRDPSPDRHHGHYYPGGRDALQLIRDRCSDMDAHVRPNTREGTPLESWGVDRGSGSLPSHGHNSTRIGHRGAMPSVSEPLRDGADYAAATWTSSNGDLEAGEVAPGPISNPASRGEHSHHHSFSHQQHHHPYHHNHHGHIESPHAGSGLGLGAPQLGQTQLRGGGVMLTGRGGGPSGSWELKGYHSGPGPGPGSTPGPGHREGPPLLSREGSSREILTRDGGREASGRADTILDGGLHEHRGGENREARDANKVSSRPTSLSSASQLCMHTVRECEARLEGGFSRESSQSIRGREREWERDRERGKGGGGASQLNSARSTSPIGDLPPSPGYSPRRTVAEAIGGTSAAQLSHPRGGGDTPCIADRGQEPYGDRRWSTGSGAHQDRHPSLGSGPPLGGSSGPATAPVSLSTRDAERRPSSHAAAMEQLDWGLAGETALGSVDRRPNISCSQGQLPSLQSNSLEASPRPARGSTAGTGQAQVAGSIPSVPPIAQPPADTHAQSGACMSSSLRRLVAAASPPVLAGGSRALKHDVIAPPMPVTDSPTTIHAGIGPLSVSSPSPNPLLQPCAGGSSAQAPTAPSLPAPASNAIELKLEAPPTLATHRPGASLAAASIDAAQPVISTAAASTPPKAAAAESGPGDFKNEFRTDVADMTLLVPTSSALLCLPQDAKGQAVIPPSAAAAAAASASFGTPPSVFTLEGHMPGSHAAGAALVPHAPPASTAPIVQGAPQPADPDLADAVQPQADVSSAGAATAFAIGLAANPTKASGRDELVYPSASVKPSCTGTGGVASGTVAGSEPLGASPGGGSGISRVGASAVPTADLGGSGSAGLASSGGNQPATTSGAGTADDGLGTERRSGLGIRRFGFGRARRAQPVKSTGEPVPEDGEQPNAALESTPSKTPHGLLPSGEAVEGEATGAVEPCAAFLPLATAADQPWSAPPRSSAVVIQPHMPGIIPITTARSTPGGVPSPLGPNPVAGAFSYTSHPTSPGGPQPPMNPIADGSLGDLYSLNTPSVAAAGAGVVGPRVSTQSFGSAAIAGVNCRDAIGPIEIDTYNMQPALDTHVRCAINTAPGPVATPLYASASYLLSQLQPQNAIKGDPAAPTGASATAVSGEVMTDLSQRIEHLETEITDLEQQLAALAVEAGHTRAQVSHLDVEVGALDEELLEDATSDDEDEDDSDAVGGARQAVADTPGPAAGEVGMELDEVSQAGMECSGGSITAGGQTMTTPTAMELHRAASSNRGRQAVAAAPRQEPQGAEAKGADDDDGGEATVAARKARHEPEEDAAGIASVPSNKARGRPRSTAKAHAVEMAAAAAADNRRKALEQKAHVPADGLLHLPAQQFTKCMLDVMRRVAAAGRDEVLRLLPDDLAARVRAVIDAAATHQAHLAGSTPATGGGRWAMIVPVVGLRVEPLYHEPQDLPAFHANAARHAVLRHAVGHYLLQRRQLVAAKQAVLLAQYANNMALYKQYMQSGIRRQPLHPSPLPMGRGTVSAAAAAMYGMYSTARGIPSYVQYSHSHSDIVRTDLDEQRLLNNFMAVEQLKHMCALPDMLLDPWERRWRAFNNRNGLVCDPVRELEEERIIKAWTEEERTLFMDKFLAHPKDFRKISAYLPGRSAGDCVAFFYKNQKLDEFGTVRRKQQLKKRRLQADMRKQQYAPLLVAPMMARQRAMGPGSGPDGGVRGVRGRANARTSAPGRVRAGAMMDAPDPQGGSMGGGCIGYGPAAVGPGGSGGAGGSILVSAAGRSAGNRVCSGGAARGLPPFQSMMLAAAQRAAAAVVASANGDPRCGATALAPVLPPMNSSGAVAAAVTQVPGPAVPPSHVAASVGWNDDDFVECYRQHGRCWEAYCRELGFKTESSAKQYYYRHRERLGLDRIMVMGARAANVAGVTVVAATSAAGPSRKSLPPARLHLKQPVASGAVAFTDDDPTANNVGGGSRPGAAVAGPTAAAVARPAAVLVEDTTDSAVFQMQHHPAMASHQSQAPVATALYDTQLQTEVDVSMEPSGSIVSTQGPVMLIPRSTGGRRHGPPRGPVSAPTLFNGPHSTGVLSLEAPELLRGSDRRYRQQDAKGDARSDSECDAIATGGPAATTGDVATTTAGSVDSLTSQIDVLAALRNPNANSLSQLLAGGMRQGSGTAGPAGPGPAPGGDGASGKVTAKAPADDVGGGSGQLNSVLNQLLFQQQEGRFGAALGAGGPGLNLGVLLQRGGLGPASGSTINLFTGPSASAVGNDLAEHFPSTGDGGGGLSLPGGIARQSGSRNSSWTEEEKAIFHWVCQVHGRDWTRLAGAIPTKSMTQIKTYFHNSRNKRPALPTPRRGQNCDARDGTGVDPGSNRWYDDSDEMERPAKRQAAGGRGPQGLELGTLMGGGSGGGSSANVSPQRGGSEGGGDAMPPAVELSGLGGLYGGGGCRGRQQQLQELLFTRDRELQAAAGAGGGGVSVGVGGGGPLTNEGSLLNALLSSLSELQGVPAAMPASVQGGLAACDHDEALGLSQGPYGGLQLHSNRQLIAAGTNALGGDTVTAASVGLGGGGGGGGLSQSQAQQAPLHSHLKQPYAHPIKLRTINVAANTLGSLFGPLKHRQRDPERDDEVRERNSDRAQDDSGGGGGDLLAALDLAGGGGLSTLSEQHQLQLHALNGSLASEWDHDRLAQEFSGRGINTQQRQLSGLLAVASKQPQPSPVERGSPCRRDGEGVTGGLSNQAIVANIMEMLADQTSQEERQAQTAQYTVGGGGNGGGGGGVPVMGQVFDLTAPLQASSNVHANRDTPLAAPGAGQSGRVAAGDLLAALLAANDSGVGVPAEYGSGGRSTRGNGEIPGGAAGVFSGSGFINIASGSNPGRALQMMIPPERCNVRGLDRTSKDGGFGDGPRTTGGTGEPVPKRQKRVSNDGASQQQTSFEMGPPLLPPTSETVSPRGTADDGGSGVGGSSLALTTDEAVAQQLLLQLHQQHNISSASLASGSGGGGGSDLRSIVHELLRDPRSQGQLQRHQQQTSQQTQSRVSGGAGTATPVLNLDFTLANRHLLESNAVGGAGSGTLGLSGGGLTQNVLRLVPLSAAVTSANIAQQQQQQRQHEQDCESGAAGADAGGLTRSQHNAPGQLSGSGQGQSSLKLQSGGLLLHPAGLAGASGYGVGPGGGGGDSLLERFLANAVQEASLAAGGGQFLSFQAGRGNSGAGQGAWLGMSSASEQLGGLAQRGFGLGQLGLLLQPQSQQPSGDQK